MKAGCPVNIRTEAEAGAGGNMISAIIVSMHTDIADPLQRLQAITRSSTAAKQRAERARFAQDSRCGLRGTGPGPGTAGQLAGKVAGKLNRAMQFNGSVSNLPGPQQELHMLGGRLQTIGAAMPVMNGYGLFVGLTTCAGELSISMSSCANILPDPGKLGDCMEQSYQELPVRPQAPQPNENRPKPGAPRQKTATRKKPDARLPSHLGSLRSLKADKTRWHF